MKLYQSMGRPMIVIELPDGWVYFLTPRGIFLPTQRTDTDVPITWDDISEHNRALIVQWRLLMERE